ncbi:hypothetical protein [Dickeya chrysanthemi]|uniref:hypothetical protein n=1 Tax=Dickeya chrysanthemi TaxID=556 RepID=UPI00057639B9|nr:hypothetical protein [Dickeya chrysanthemi]
MKRRAKLFSLDAATKRQQEVPITTDGTSGYELQKPDMNEMHLLPLPAVEDDNPDSPACAALNITKALYKELIEHRLCELSIVGSIAGGTGNDHRRGTGTLYWLGYCTACSNAVCLRYHWLQRRPMWVLQ